MAKPAQWKKLAVRMREVDPRSLTTNPKNWRIHGAAQREALRGSIHELGYGDPVELMDGTDLILDGHLRVDLAIQEGQETITVVDMALYTDAEADQYLLTKDPIAAMANADKAKLESLMADVSTGEEAVQAMLAEMAEREGIVGYDGNVAPIADADRVYDDEAIFAAAVRHFRAAGFPYRNLPIHVCMQEINNLAETDVDKLLNTNTAYAVADTYHPHRVHASATGMGSPFEAFQDDDLLLRAMRLALEHGSSLSGSLWGKLLIVSGTQACANFRPGYASLLYRRFCKPGDTVLDTSTGYGGRLVGFMAAGVAGRYIGIDPNVPTHDGNVRMAADLGFADKVELHNLPAEDVPHHVIQDRCDFAFTSPPYFAKERYSDDSTQSWVRYGTIDDWRDGFLKPMLALQHAALKDDAVNVVNIADVTIKGKTYPLVDLTKQAAADVGFDLTGVEDFGLSRRFGAGQDEETATEPALIFRKQVPA